MESDEISNGRRKQKKTCPSPSSAAAGGMVTGSGSDVGIDPYHIEWLEYTEEERLHIVQVLRRDLQLKWTDYNRIRLVIFDSIQF